MSGLFVVLEGGEGAGKSTQIALLSGWLEALGVDHLVTREPGGTAVGEAIRSVVLGRTDLDMPPETELFLILGARAAFVRDVVRPAMAAGRVVLADRFALSTMAYQGYGRGLDLHEVRKAVAFATGGLEPDLYVVLDVPVEEGRSRQSHAGMSADRIESAGDGFMAKVREGYLALAEVEPNVRVLEARGTPEEVHRRIRDCLIREFPNRFPADAGGV
ncbi:MAG: dTMP kinase [Gemmatimonadota bacterium]|nr:dTMP kinase [Gemmatimonadota bacterium]